VDTKTSYHLNTSINFRVSVIKEERVLSIVLDFTLTLWLSSHIVIVARLEVVSILFQVIRNVSTFGNNY